MGSKRQRTNMKDFSGKYSSTCWHCLGIWLKLATAVGQNVLVFLYSSVHVNCHACGLTVRDTPGCYPSNFGSLGNASWPQKKMADPTPQPSQWNRESSSLLTIVTKLAVLENLEKWDTTFFSQGKVRKFWKKSREKWWNFKWVRENYIVVQSHVRLIYCGGDNSMLVLSVVVGTIPWLIYCGGQSHVRLIYSGGNNLMLDWSVVGGIPC